MLLDASPSLSHSQQHVQGPRQLELYVSNLDPCAILDDEDLARLFSEYGTVLLAKLAVNAGTGQSLGYGVVKMSSSQEADFARTQVQGQGKSPAFSGPKETITVERAYSDTLLRSGSDGWQKAVSGLHPSDGRA